MTTPANATEAIMQTVSALKPGQSLSLFQLTLRIIEMGFSESEYMAARHRLTATGAIIVENKRVRRGA